MTERANELDDIIEAPDMGIPLTDGCRLSARVWMPENAASRPVPAILEYLPYRKRDGTVARDQLTHPYFAARGYACVRVDMRGNGDSEGLMTDEYTEQELSDGVEVINWLANQPWCNGRVGMMGISWGGFNGLQIAALQPDPLKAVITLCSTVDRFADDIHYKGGCLLNENLGWGSTMWAYSSRPPDPLLRDNWRDMWLERLRAEPFLPAVWLRHQTRDAYWKHGSICEDYSALKARILAVGGWGDAYKNAVPAIVENVPGSKGIIGPWVHKYPHFAVPEPRIGFLQEALRWWDKWLKDLETGVEDDPDLTVYAMDGVRPRNWYLERPGRWIEQRSDRIDTRIWHLGDDGRLGNAKGAADTLVASPQDCGMAAGEYCAIWLGPETPGEQRIDDAKSACWDSETLSEDLVISGAATVSLRLLSNAGSGQIAVRLNHVHPDGASTRITYGVLNLAHRNGHDQPVALAIDQPFDVSLSLDHIAYTVPKGHRIRLAVSNSYWPLLWPAPDKSELIVESGDLTVPFAKGVDGNERIFPDPDSARPWQTETLRDEAHIRRTETDHVTGRVSLVIEDDFGKRRDLDHGLISGSIARERWDIHPDDPLSARGNTHWTEEVERGEIRMRTETFAEMTADKSSFHLRATLEAYENDEIIFSKEVEERISRNGI